VWLAIAAALGRWLAEAVVKPQMGLEGLGWMALLPVVLVAAAGSAMSAQGLLRRRGWARWAAVVAFSLVGVTALAELVDWILPLGPSRAHGWGPVIAERVAVDLVTAVLFLAFKSFAQSPAVIPSTEPRSRCANRKLRGQADPSLVDDAWLATDRLTT
jgi:hypothetical protein